MEIVKTRLLFKKDLVESEINIILKDTMVAKNHISFTTNVGMFLIRHISTLIN